MALKKSNTQEENNYTCHQEKLTVAVEKHPVKLCKALVNLKKSPSIKGVLANIASITRKMNIGWALC